MKCIKIIMSAFIFISITSTSQAQDFNPYVLKAVEYLYKNHAKGGYDIRRSFTHEFEYGQEGKIKPSSAPLTMCVAAVSEVIIYAQKIYAKETGDNSVFTKIPLGAWTKGTPASLRANIFMFDGTGSRGTGHTLAKYSLGEELRFQDLRAGDFINLNRSSGSGHAVVFLGYLDKATKITDQYSLDVVGFKYFSAQGKGRPDAGFAYRNAYFGDFCPSSSTVPRDCKVIRSNSRALLNAGRMWSPDRWDYLGAVERQKLATRSILEDQNPAATKSIISDLLDVEMAKELALSPADQLKFDGVTTD